jgi:uncharacterized membrane protein YbaN (DUF454 family)
LLLAIAGVLMGGLATGFVILLLISFGGVSYENPALTAVLVAGAVAGGMVVVWARVRAQPRRRVRLDSDA